MFHLPRTDFDRLLQAQVLVFQERFASYFAGCLIVLSAEKSLLSIEAPESQYQVLGENWTKIYDAARLSLGCQIVKLSPLKSQSNEINEYTGQRTDTEAGDMNSASAVMPGRVAIETSVHPTAQWASLDNTESGGWIGFESLATRLGRDVKEIIRMVAKARIPSFRHAETLEEGLDRQGVVQLLTAYSQAIYSELDFQDMEAAAQPSVESTEVNDSPEAATGNAMPDNQAASLVMMTEPVMKKISLKLPADWTPKHNPQGENFSRNPSPMTALTNALLTLGINADSKAYWEVMERLQRRRIDKEAKTFLEAVTGGYADKNTAFTKLREQTCKLWDKHVENTEESESETASA